MRSVVSADWVLPVGAPPLRDGAVAIEDGRIAAVGPQSELGRGRRYEDAVIAPGLVNCHSHLEYAVYAGFGDGLADFSDWIGVHVERKRRLEPADVLDVARLGAAECLACGVTTVGDCSFTGAAASACAELGLRATVFLEVFGADPDAAIRRFGELRDRAEPALSERVRLGVSPHAPYTTSAAVYEACAELGLPTATHLSESESELAYLIEGGGPWRRLADMLVEPPRTTGPRLLERVGALRRGLVAAHCVAVDEAEIDLLAAHGVAVAHCPRSNALLGCGAAPLRALLDRGVAVGLGTDSPASSPSFDMFEELRAAVALARARERRPDALGAREALELATIGSARTLGLDAEIGSLEPGKRADLVVVSLAGSPFLPWEDPEAALVLGGDADRVLATVVGGEVRYERGAFDWRELRQRGARARGRLLGLHSR
ncbi:MAG TPA: amidohydrolase family protein [Gaiellaceae bacterium]|nr:amidohydrolase family protein [Gaiellaceae bacterium]